MINDIKTDQSEFEITTPETKNLDVTAGKIANNENPESENPTRQSSKDNPAAENTGKKDEKKIGFAIDEKEKLNDGITGGTSSKGETARETREDSILSRPKTETYIKDTSEDTGKIINDMNNIHAREEEKRKQENSGKHGKPNEKLTC